MYCIDTEIIMKIKYVEETPFRPRLDADSDKDMVSLMRICWDENPKSRPTFSTIKKEATRLKWYVMTICMFLM